MNFKPEWPLMITSLMLLSFFVCHGVKGQKKADLIIYNGNVVTLDSNRRVDAVAISDKRIIATGTNQAVMKTKSNKTTMINAGGRTVIPGLFDSHLHVIRGGRFYNAELRWDGVKTLSRALQMLKEQASRTPPGQWVRVVGGWNEYQFEEKRLPTLAEINEATGNTPAFILYLYAKAWINKAGLNVLQITGSTANPAGGLFEKDEAGHPTGLLVAEPNAFILYSTLAKLPELTTAEKLNSTLQYIRELNSLGVAAVMDAGGGFQNFPDDYRVTDSLYRQGRINLRLPYYLFAQKKGTEVRDFEGWIDIVDLHAHNSDSTDKVDYYVAGGGENLVAEAADFENFLQPRPQLADSMESKLLEVVQLLAKKRWPFRIHATYDESISRMLNVLETVNREIPLTDLPWFIDHAETVSDTNLERIKALGGGISIQHRMAYQGEHFVRRYGTAAAAFTPPVKKMLAYGIPVALGTDGTRVASYNPWVALHWITTGKTIGGTRTMSTDNLIDRQLALQLMTSGGYDLLRQKHHGKLLEGYKADIVILDKNYFSVPDDEIPTIRSVLTIVDGKPVYGDQHIFPMAPDSIGIIPDWSPVKFYGGYQFK
ncbi:amidohydrolase [Flavitalea antarctica]